METAVTARSRHAMIQKEESNMARKETTTQTTEKNAQATRIFGTVPRGTRLTIQAESGGYGRTSAGATWIRLKQTSRR